MKLLQYNISQLLEAFGAKRATPGGGSAAALAGSTAASLLMMAEKISGLQETDLILEELHTTQSRLATLIDEDAEGFSAYVKAKAGEKEDKLKTIILIPLETSELSYSLFGISAELVDVCDPMVVTDIGVGVLLARAGVEGALMNVSINLASISDMQFKAGIEDRIHRFGNIAAKERQLLQRIKKLMVGQ